MSFKNNPPWQKNVPIANFQQMNLQQLQQLGFANPAFQQQFHHNQIHLPIQYQNAATARVNTMAFQQQSPQQTISQQNNSQASQPASSSNQSKYNANLKVFSGTGIVSKIQNDIGFIDDEVLFHKNVCVKGMSPKLGDRVLVEAAFNQNMPFKWNATRVQVLPRTNTGSNSVSDNKSYGQHEASNSDSYRNRRYSPERDRRNERTRPRSRDNRDTDEENERKRRREERERPRQRESVEIRDRTKSPRRPSPKRRRGPPIPRYMVQIPKISLSLMNLDCFEVKRRYPNLYIPSDFTIHENKWMNVFPMEKPFSIQKHCTFHIMKDVNPVDETVNECVLDPSDADYTWSAKVMLLSMPSISEIYKKCIVRAEDSDKHDHDAERDFIHPSRLINFLVGVRGKNETMAIGGPWSKKLDGENPESDPSVLIRTAIRTCKGLTGIDLSKCTQWYRFVEIKYRRSEQNKKDGSGDGGSSIKPARIENVVIFLPDIHSCMPNKSEWDGVKQQYKQALEKLLTAPDVAEDSVSIVSQDAVVTADNSKDIPPKSTSEPASSSTVLDVQDDAEMTDAPAPTADETEAADDDGTQKDLSIDAADSEVISEEIADGSVWVPKNMKVAELRAELSARNLSTKGLKNELVERLEKALNSELEEKVGSPANGQKTEETKETSDDTPMQLDEKSNQDMEMNIAEMDISEVTVIDEYDSTKCDEQEEKSSNSSGNKKKPEPKKMDEKERHMWEKRYTLPDTPHITVHPSKTARNGKFDCTVVSLSLLLDYRKDDTKEHSFEIALFAEAFNEMLMRDFGFNIYKAFNVLSINNSSAKAKDDEKVESADNEKSNDASDADSKSNKDDKNKLKKSNSTADDKERAVKQVTAYPDLLLSFSYFDQTQCGYIFEKDIEELFYCLGINLSRSQIRKLTEKFVTRESLYYRKLTDRPVDAPAVANPFENVTEEQLQILAQGNRCMPAKSSNEIEMSSQSNEIVTFEGTPVNLRQIMYQMKRIEAAYEESEKQLVDLKKSNSDLKVTNHKNEKRIKDLNADLKSVSRKLQDAESGLSSITRKYNECFSTIQSINERIAPVIARNERSRDKDGRKTEKSSDKSEKKDKPKEEVKASTSDTKVDKTPIKTEKKEVVKEEQPATESEKAKEVPVKEAPKEEKPEKAPEEAAL